MNTIYKYTLHPGRSEISMPKGAKVLSVATQRENVCLWALCDPSAPNESRNFVVYGTGHPITDPDSLVFLGTVLFEAEGLVFHVFEVEGFQP